MREYRALLEGIPYQLVSLSDIGLANEVQEEEKTFRENAEAKALTFAGLSRMLTMADDSGLEVEALNGAPGVCSRRYAGEDASDEDRLRLLLGNMADLPPQRRRARFVCIIALAGPDGLLGVFEGECWGNVSLEPRGQEGFGYDPVFYLPEMGKTMAELSFEEKNRVSHRARAAEKVRAYLTRGS